MPELPEVETTVRALRKEIIGRKIKDATATALQLFENRKLFRNIGNELSSDRFDAIDRRGKYLMFHLRSRRVLVAHMKLTGHFLVKDKRQKANDIHKHVRFRIDFADGSALLFSDLRKFGRFWLLAPDKISRFFEGRKLAHDALSKEASEAYLHTQLTRNRAVKSLLLDQTIIAGIGNIYADELLWAAKVHPARKGAALSGKEVSAIHGAMRDILKKGIRAGGTSIRDYLHPDGSAGHFQDKRAAYQRTGQPCLRCKTPIRRIVVAQRGTYYCPKCQTIS